MEYIVNVFTHNGKGGNKAGVVIVKEYISKDECQKKAKELGFSETVFVKKISENIFELKFYTPQCEIEFCGHASLGAFYVLRETGAIVEGEYIERLNFKDLKVIVEKEKIFLEQDSIKIESITELERVLQSIGVKKEDLHEDLEIVVGYSGLRDILIPVKNRKILNNLDIDLEKIKYISKDYSAVGYHVYTIENNRVYCRNFAPLYGIDEEAATGSSNGALFGYLNTIERYKSDYLEFFQGENYGACSKITGRVIDGKIYVGSEF
ncbi:PhzF family phenazine biosynthesis protein [Cetobacterium somerae]|uniref:PhzF family phenazine biosynthesis protein n=1 Tax=Cetobacterium somerae TaxID=188913 RepID=UPI00211DF638|nr:PhzF family phenazine biosynthesis protein [Cetobacterium somerae]MCQ9626770.1 PhzF family phenazine biosynthesis protein [Cetobacterium somerae]